MSCRHVLAENAETTSFTQKRICHWYIMLGVMPLETPIIWRNSIRSFQAGTSILNAEQFDRLKSLQKCLLAMHTLSAVDVPCASLALNVSLPHSLVLRQGDFLLSSTCWPLVAPCTPLPGAARPSLDIDDTHPLIGSSIRTLESKQIACVVRRTQKSQRKHKAVSIRVSIRFLRILT